MAPPRLPPHLSYKSALALLPPSTIIQPIEAVRRVHDAHFARWPPHINLIYPFLASPLEVDSNEQQGGEAKYLSPACLKQEIRARIQKVVGTIQPFRISLTADPAGTFHHSKRSKTVWLDPLSSNEAVKSLQEALQAEFSECDADGRPFNPHLSVGQANNDDGVENLKANIKSSIADYLSNETPEERQGRRIALDWYLDKVFVIQRDGYHGRFKVVGAIKLGIP